MGLLAPGAVIAGYRIESVIGRGGMGVVYRARELELDRDIALKVIAPELLEDGDIRSRFLREVRAAASVEHPNVVPVHAAGERNGVAFLAMRLIDGEDLKRLVAREGALPPGRAAEVVRRAAAGLDAIHRAGYVHRDVKPANVLVDRDGHVYVSDFGLARQVLDSVGPTGPGRWVGTLDYVAPEQIRGERVDARADVYALGGVLAFVLTGRVPYEREGDEAKLWAQLSEAPPIPSQMHEGIAPAFDAVVARAMAKAPEDRYPSAGDLARAGRAAAAGRPLPTSGERAVARGDAALEALEDASTVTAAVTAPARPRRSRRPLALLAAALAAAAAVAIAVVWIDGDAPRSGSAATLGPQRVIHNVGHRPNGIVLVAGDAWVTSGDQERLDRIDTATLRERAQHPRVGLGASSIVTQGDHVWVAANRSRTVTQLDARTGDLVRTLRPGGAPWRLALGSGSLWVGTTAEKPGANTLTRYDLNGRPLSRRPFPHGIAALAATDDAIWVAEREPPTVVRFDPRTGATKLWAKLAGPAAFLGVGGGYLWASMGTEDLVLRINPRRFGDLAPTSAGHRPQQSVAAGDRLYVASNTDHTLLVFDPRTGRQAAAPVSTELNPYALAADSRYVWVTGLGGNTLTRLTYR